jgi:hypothetical protein
MRTIFVAVPALLFAGMAVAQGNGRPDPRDHGAKVPPVEFRSAFEGYRPYAEADLRDWRKSNDEVGAARGHASKPPPAQPAGKGEKAPAHQGQGGHK